MIQTLSRGSRSTIRHNIFMALIKAERCGLDKAELISSDTALTLQGDANTITDMIAAEYLSKRGAGALWLARQLSDSSWLDSMQERSWRKP